MSDHQALVLVSWIAAAGAGAVAITADIAGGAGAVGAARGLDAILRSDPRTFDRFLRTAMQGDAARAKGATRTIEETRRILDEALRRGYRIRSGVDANWVGGRHVNLVPPVGPRIHFPLPAGFMP